MYTSATDLPDTNRDFKKTSAVCSPLGQKKEKKTKPPYSWSFVKSTKTHGYVRR